MDNKFKAALTLTALAGLNQNIDNAKLPQSLPDQEGKKITVVVPAATSELPKGVVDFHSENPSAKDSMETVTHQTETTSQSPIAETSVVHADVAVTPEAAKPDIKPETKTITASAVNETKPVVEEASMSLELGPKAFGENLKELLLPMLKGKASLDSLDVTGDGDHLSISAVIVAPKVNVKFIGNLGNTSGGLSMISHELQASFLIKVLGEKTISNKVKTVLDQLKAQLEVKYKDSHPAGIDSLQIEKGALKIIFKKNG